MVKDVAQHAKTASLAVSSNLLEYDHSSIAGDVLSDDAACALKNLHERVAV